MNIPPSDRRSSSTPSSRGRPDDAEDRHSKEFKLPAKKDQLEGKEEETKKKDLFELAAHEIALQEKQQNLSESLKSQSISTAEIKSMDGVAQVNQVSQLIQKMVATMRIGEVDGKSFAALDLKKGSEVPEAFAGSQLTLSYQANGLAIHFDRFMTVQQENTAIILVEKNKEQLQQMVVALNSKNIQVAELVIGNHTVALPRVEPLPPPFQAPPPPQTEQQRREGRQQDKDDGDTGGPQ